MKTRKVLALLVASLAVSALSFGADAFFGTWKLNESKSQIAQGAPKNNTVVYAAAGKGITVSVDGVDASGNPIHNEWTGKFDGSDYLVTGDPNSDFRSYKKIDDHTLMFTSLKGGKVVVSGRVVISPDGRTRTVTTKGIDAQGNKFESTAVYDRQ
jgi:hypothetical protein